MSKLIKTTLVPEGLVAHDPSALALKIADFVRAGAGGMHVIFDFDRTLTVKKPGSQDEVTTWHILHEHLPVSGQLQYQRLFKKYRALELNGSMTQEDAVAWFSGSLNLFVEHGIDLSVVEKDFLDRASIRPGVADLFKICADNDIPTVILSAGIREVINIWCRKYEIKPSLVISTELTLGESSKIVGWQKDTLVHALNKSEASHPELLEIRSRRPHTLLTGDGLDDANMATGAQEVIRVRVLDPRQDETANNQERQRTFKKFDALVTSGSLQPLFELVERIGHSVGEIGQPNLLGSVTNNPAIFDSHT